MEGRVYYEEGECGAGEIIATHSGTLLLYRKIEIEASKNNLLHPSTIFIFSKIKKAFVCAGVVTFFF